MLTESQIADFERRANAGEQPIYKWDVPRKESYCIITPRVYEFSGSVEIIQNGVRRSSGEPPYWLKCYGRAWSLETLTAAQLAAESLLREATAPLHRERTREAIRKGIEMHEWIMGDNAIKRNIDQLVKEWEG